MIKPLAIFLLILLSASISTAEDYVMPIGVPNPGVWGAFHPINSVAPSTATKCPEWPTGESAGCYYINASSTNPTCSDSTNGYPNEPRCTIATSYGAGSYVEVTGGPYNLGTVSLLLNGTVDNPVWFRGTPDAMPDIKASFVIKDSKYAVVEYLDINNTVAGGVALTGSTLSHNVVVRNNTFRNFSAISGAVCGATPLQDGSIHDIVYYNNYFGDIGNWQAIEDEDYHCINPGLWGRHPPTTVYNIWVLSNTAYHVAGSLNQFQGDVRDASAGDRETPIRLITNTNLQNLHHVYSGKNLMYQSRQAMGAPKFTTDAIYSQNVAYNSFSISSGAGTGQVFQEGSRYVWMLFNKYYDLTYGIRQSNTNFVTPNQDARYMAGDATYTFTADPSTNTITSVAHGQSNKDLIGIKLDSGTLPEPLLIETPYYIRNATADTFQLCLTTNIDDPIVDVTTIGLGVYSFFESSSYSERTADLRAYMIGNVIYNTQNDHDKAYGNTSSYKPNQGVGFEKALYKRYIVDNTIFDVGGGINIGNQFPYDETVMSGDVIAGVYGVDDSGDKDFHITMTATGGTDNTFLNYSFFQPRADDGTVNFKWAGAEPSSSIGSLEALQSSSVGQCQNCWTGDPMFVDPAAYDLHPKAGSPLIGKNVRHAVYDEFEARYGLSIDVDFDGNPRPPTAAEGRTIGAYEFDTGYIPPDPECDQYHPSLCLDQTSCTGAGLNWCDEACQVSECGAEPTCADLTQNGDETGIDCGGSCPPCETPMQTARWLRLAAGPVKIVDQPE